LSSGYGYSAGVLGSADNVDPTPSPALEVTVDNETRRGEASPHPFRSTRFFNSNGEWYFSTREGQDVGPFPDREETEASLLEYLRRLATMDQRIVDG